MTKKSLKYKLFRVGLVLLVICLLMAAASFFINHKVKADTADDIIYVVTDREEGISGSGLDDIKDFDADCILVLGCGIEDENTPSPMLKDRLDTGIELYKKGAAPKLLLSGDNGQEGYNEIHVMFNYAKAHGVPKEDIFCDHAGFSTYDSIYRADSIFGVKKALIVTQKYHQYRALYVAEALGLEAKGVAAEQERYGGQFLREAREILARDKDFFKAALRVEAKLDGEAIPISGSGVISQDE